MFPAQCLFPFERVFEAADGVLNLARYLVGLALRLQLGVTDRLADRLLDCAFDLFRRSGDPILIHDVFLQMPSKWFNNVVGPAVVFDLDQTIFPSRLSESAGGNLSVGSARPQHGLCVLLVRQADDRTASWKRRSTRTSAGSGRDDRRS